MKGLNLFEDQGILMTMGSMQPSHVISPCIQCCTLDEEGVCKGCHRTKNEIMLWTRLTLDGQREVLRRCRARAGKAVAKQA